ncbi:MAG: TetR family transcriptional regulator [Betaproteobacteria bacterium]
MVRRTRDEAIETRNTILDTAERVFSEHGVSHTSLADIAAAAGVTRGAIYWHFKNKADLFDAMMNRVVLPMEQMAARAGDTGLDDPLAYVRACALNVLERVVNDPQCRRVFEICCHKCEYVDEMSQVRDRHIEGRDKCLSHIENGLRNAARKGMLARGVDPRHAAVGLHALVDGLIMNWILDPRYVPLKKEAGSMIDLYLGGLRGPASPTPQRRAKGKSVKRRKSTRPASAAH